MISVLHVTTDGRIGGAERLIADVVRAARRNGQYEPSVCVLRRGGDLRAELTDTPIQVHELGLGGPASAPRVLAALTRLLARQRYDVVHTHLIHASAIGLMAAKLARAPLAVMTRHYERYVWIYGTALDRMLQRTANRLADHVFAISEAVRRTLVEREGVSPARITTVPNGIDIQRVRRLGIVATSAVSPAGITIGSVGSLERRKGHEYLMEALALLQTEPPPRLLLVGDGPLRTELERLALKLGVRHRVELTGYQADPYRSLARMDIYAQPSLEEGFGIAVIEAMALERPVVAADTGGLPEIVKDGVNGLLVAPRDPRALAQTLARLAENADLRRRLGGAGRALVEARFDAATTAARYGDAYRRLLRPRAISG